jgi:hypothetical protein
MGIWRTLYREIRLILGFSAPPETPSQLAERIAGELKSELGGKKGPHGEDWFLESKFSERAIKVLFDAAGRRAIIQVESSLAGGPLFMLVHQDAEHEQPAGTERVAVTGGIFAEGTRAEIKVMQDLWKALPTGTRGNTTSLLNRVKGTWRHEDGLVLMTPTAPNLDGPSAKYNVKSLIQTVVSLTAEMEEAWSKL